MEASSSPHGTHPVMVLRAWPFWRLPLVLRIYVASVPVAAGVMLWVSVAHTSWRLLDVAKFFVVLACGLISVAATPRAAYGESGMVRDFVTVWVLPIAILLPPVYAVIAPAPLLALTQLVVRKTIVYRRVFTVGALGLAYGAASYTFRVFPHGFAGGTIGAGKHALTWAIAVAACELVGWTGHHIFIVGAIKLTDPTAQLSEFWSREALQGDVTQIDLAVLITVVVAANPALAVFAVPTVFLVRRFLVHSHLVAQSRIDAKTGLLNVTTWEREAEAEVSRAIRTRSPLSIALIDIDHFKRVNDTYGHLVGDRVLRAVTDALTRQLRNYDRAGRFGGEEFVILLPQTCQADARNIAERLRRHIAGLAVPIDDTEDAQCVRLTISVGVAAMDGSGGELTDLVAAADAALYYAKQAGRNRTHVFASSLPLVPSQSMADRAADRRTTMKQAGHNA